VSVCLGVGKDRAGDIYIYIYIYIERERERERERKRDRNQKSLVAIRYVK
jgi:hypothetical protein